MRMGWITEAKSLIDSVRDSAAESESGGEPFSKSYHRAVDLHEYIKDTADCTKCASKKRWADMAEEEDEERVHTELENAEN